MRSGFLQFRTPHSPAALCFLAAPFCYRFDGETYEGQKTAVSWHWGVVRGTSMFPGHEEGMHRPGPTASAGAVLAVDRRVFVALGGFDPLYLPGRLEDLDFAYRGYLAGYRAVHVPDAIAFHRGAASFGPAHGAAGCDILALRNTLLFQWKNLAHPLHLAREAVGWPLRLLLDIARAPFVPRDRRWAFARAWTGAWLRRSLLGGAAWRPARSARREWSFFHEFHPRRINRVAAAINAVTPPHRPVEARTSDREALCR
jgi:N-acetylglucosaminyl-diphospho-decaprenol L-rhamnosyltransferase